MTVVTGVTRRIALAEDFAVTTATARVVVTDVTTGTTVLTGATAPATGALSPSVATPYCALHVHHFGSFVMRNDEHTNIYTLCL